MKIQTISMAALNPASYNPRADLQPGDPAYDALKRSIDTFGLVEPVIWNEQTGNVVGGHQRLKVLLENGIKEVECVVVDLDDENEKALNLALNKISGDWDDKLLREILIELQESDFDIELTGFVDSEIEEILRASGAYEDEAIEDDFDVEEAVAQIDEPVTKPGNIWQLGQHRLMCGDSTAADDVRKLMGGSKAKIVFTDPPWNVDYGSDAKHPARQILNDNMSTEQFGAFLLAAFKRMSEVSEPGCMTYVVMSAQEWGNIMPAMREAGYHWSSTIIWAKDSLVLSRKDYHTQYEPLWYGWLGTEKRLCPLKDRKQSDLWQIPRPKVSVEHPTMKPVALVAKALLNSSCTGDVALDLFGGSGTTLIAAEQTKRVCRMMELDAKYCDVIVRRWEELSGQTARLC